VLPSSHRRLISLAYVVGDNSLVLVKLIDMRILVIEDDPRIAGFIEKGLTESGYAVAVARNGEDGYLDARYNPYDLVVLDLMLPNMDGIELTRKLRAEKVTTPILMLTARDMEGDKIRGLDVGADDYLTKPFGFGELLARIRALLRRESMSRSSVMRVNDLEVDTAARHVYRGGREIPLSGREYMLLEYLIHHAGQVVTRELLMENVWSDAEVESNVIDVYVGYLRQKVDAPSRQPLIHTVRGVGYTLRVP
jgi:DNA-binding response OmpR family regulator